MTLRIAHATDIHFTEVVTIDRLLGKRLIGTANQVFGGRLHQFPAAVQEELVRHVLELAPDLFVITGDLTAQALPTEFEKARRILAPVLEAVPTLVLAGNHDVYTRGSQKEDRIRQYFGDWMFPDGPIARWSSGEVVVLALDPNRPTTWHASGELPEAQLDALRAALDDSALDGRFVILALHYPLVDKRGALYDLPSHGLRNAAALMDVLRAARTPPRLLLHGHHHHGYRVEVPLPNGKTLASINCGTSGQAWQPALRRAAAMTMYTVTAPDGLEVERYLHDGAHFRPEPGGPFATGR